MIDIGQNDNISVGDNVILFGEQKNDRISITEICKKLHTIAYEVTCWVSRRVPRIHIKE